MPSKCKTSSPVILLSTLLFVVGVSIFLVTLALFHAKINHSSNQSILSSKFSQSILNGTLQPITIFNDDECERIDHFKELTQDIVLTQAFMNESTYIIRWIIAYDNNTEEAAVNFRETIKWRTENRIDDILAEDYSDVLNRCPFSMEGHDKTGNPIAIVPFGSWELNKVVVSTDTDRLYRNQLYMLEKYARIVQDLSSRNNKVQKLFAIIDLNGFNLRAHGCTTCISLMTNMFKIFEQHYPEFAESWFLINVPMAGRTLISLLLPLLSERNSRITQVYGYDKGEWSSELLKHIDADQLPKKYV